MIKINVLINNKLFIANLYYLDVSKELISLFPLKIRMDSLEHEKFFNFDKLFTSNPKKVGTINKGDIMLFGSSCLVLFYESFSTNYSYTKIGEFVDKEGASKALNIKDIVISMFI